MENNKLINLRGIQKKLGVHVIIGDGGCLFGALLHQLFGIETSGYAYQEAVKDLRRLVVRHMRRNLLQYAPYLYPEGVSMDVQDGKQVEQVLNDIERGSRWGGEETILAVSEIFQTQIVVVHNYTIYRYGNREGDSGEQCWVYYHDQADFEGKSSSANHYDSVTKCINAEGGMEYEWRSATHSRRTTVRNLIARNGMRYNAVIFEGTPDALLLALCHQTREKATSPLGLRATLLQYEIWQFEERNEEWLANTPCPPEMDGMASQAWKLIVAGANVLEKRILVTNAECCRIGEVIPDTHQRAFLAQNLWLYFDTEGGQIGSLICARKRAGVPAETADDKTKSQAKRNLMNEQHIETNTEEDNDCLTIVSWNVRGCCRIEKRNAIDAALAQRDVHIALLQEVNTDCETINSENYKWQVHKSPANKQRGLAVLLRKASGILISNVERVNDNIMKLSVIVGKNQSRKSFSILNVHAPNKGISRFLGDLGIAFMNSSCKDKVMICGDFNAQLGKSDLDEQEMKLIGKYAGHKVANENGRQLKFFMRTHNLAARNTMAHHSLFYTWFSKDKSSQIDHVLNTHQSRIFVKKLRGAKVKEVQTDHKLLLFKTQIRDRGAKDSYRKGNKGVEQNIELSIGWDVKLLQEESFRKKYQEQLAEITIDVENPSVSTSQVWDMLVNKLRSAASRTINKTAKIPTSPTRRKALADLKKSIFWRKRNPLSTRRIKEHLKAQNNYRKVCYAREEKDELEFFKKLQQYKPGERIRRTYKYLKNNKKERQCKNTMDISLAQFQEADCEDLLPILIEEQQINDEENHEPGMYHIDNIIKRSKNGKAAGEDGIQIELLKYADEATTTEFKMLLKRVWKENVIPDGWRRTLCVPIPKKKNAKSAKDFRKITLASAAYKIYASWLLGYLIENTGPIGNHQAGFLNERSTVDHIFTARRIMEEKWNAGDNLVVMSLDIEKAFDNVSLKTLSSVLEAKGATRKLSNRVINCMIEEEQRVYWKGQKTAPKMRKKGVKQGCPLSPYVFDLVMEEVLLAVEAELGGFLRLNQSGRIRFPIILVYADDILIIARTVEELDKILPVLIKHLDRVNLKLNEAKCQVLVRYPKGTSPEEVKIDGIIYKTSSTIYHLGVPITERLQRPLTTRKRSRDAIGASKAILQFIKERRPSRMLGKVIYETIISPTMAYGTQAMVLTKRSRKSLRRYERQIYSQIEGLCEAEGQTTDGDCNPNSPRSITKWIRILQLRYWGHIIRRPENHLLKLAAEYRLPHKKRGRPSFTWWDTIAQSLWRFDNISVDEWYELAKDKENFEKTLKEIYDQPESASDDE